jgi:hypothetical protein
MSKPAWNLNVKSLSHQQLVEILRELQDTPYVEIVRDLRKELVERLKSRGVEVPEIIKRLSYAVPRGRKLNEVAGDWAETLGTTVEEFKRIADAK